MAENEVLDPHHEDSEVVVAGVSTVGDKKDEKPEPKVSEDGNLVELGGHKYVREEALVNERKARQEASKVLEQLAPYTDEINEFLRAKRDRREATVARAGGDSSDYTDDDLQGYAITRGYYQADETTPDTKRAKQELDIFTEISRRQAESVVAPIARGTQAETSRTYRERAYDRKFVDGQPIAGKEYIDLGFQSLGDKVPIDENVANLVQIIGAGLEYLDARKNGRVRTGRGGRGEPMLVEGSSGRLDLEGDGEVSALDRAAARARGKTDTEWAKTMKQATASKTGELEAV